ncbi:MAG: thioredoxin domain-containing protein [Candidatus Bathyarchaeota archaeon]|nr:MAG: thioredoxin domain-containing protein [Candidatus Bathyarchaeota archaeon]
MTKPNRLAKEKSPYLLQHAQNPVDWYPWSEEAFMKAEKEDKPVFLSIGYSTCHWCHVMERESFEDKEVAEILNRNFVSIKVDREERPDIDKIYMKTCVLMTGSGGWPLTIVMTPKKQPFFVATYLPKRGQAGILGLVDLLRNVAKSWESDKSKLISAAESATEYLIEYVQAKQREEELTEIVFDEAYIRLLDGFDQNNAGFGTTPKFPSPHNLLFLLRYWKRKGMQQALEMVEKTLQKMRLGGIFDQVGFGFHRYSTDSRWLVPHFEKMLYDQAMISIAYTEAYQATGKEEYRKTAEEIFEYVLRDMTNPKGGFFSAEDADSEGQEGRFYMWTEEEIKTPLGENADFIINAFNISREGNYYDEVQRGKTGRNILHLKEPLLELSTDLSLRPEELASVLTSARQKLFEAREERVHPLKDDKILTDWNGLMIAALAKGAQVFNATRLSEAAENAAGFILEKLQKADGRLIHRFRDGEATIDGNLDDYAFLIWGLIELYEATFDTRYLKEALRLQDDMMEHFWDKENGGFFFKADDSEKLLIRHKEPRDGALPSGNSVAFLNLIRLSRMTGKTHYEEKAAILAKAFSTHEEGTPSHNTMFLTALDFFIGPANEIAIVGNPDSKETKNMLHAIRKRFVPNKVMLLKIAEQKNLENIAVFTKDMKMINNKTTAYICRNFVCNKPMTEIEEVLKVIADANRM